MPTLDNLRKSARRWLKSLRDGDPEARARLKRAYPGAPDRPTLRDVQHALARERGHESWIAMTRAIAARVDETPLTALLVAAGIGDVERVAAILDEHPGIVNERGTLGTSGLRTALHFGSGHEAVVRLLLERGADPNIRDEGDNAFPIHFAAERGDLNVVAMLIERGADPIGAGTTHLLDVLGWAVCFDYAMHLDVAHYLLAHGASHTLASAAAMGDGHAIRALAASGADLSERMDRTNKRRTVLHLAAVKRQPAAVAALIAAGADLNQLDAVGLTPLDQAAFDGQDDIVDMLVAAGAAVSLPAAIVLDRQDDIERILKDDPEALSATNSRQWARLIVHASTRASRRVMDTLLGVVMRHRSGLSIVNMEDDLETAVDGVSGYTPLHAAAFNGNDGAVQVLLRHGADPRRRDGKYCSTPAGWAAYAGHTATMNLILDADVDIFDAIAFDRADRVAAILDADSDAIDRPFKAYASCSPEADSEWPPAPDCTPLQFATRNNRDAPRRVLVDRGAGARTAEDVRRADLVVQFLQSACWDEHVSPSGHARHDRAAQRMLAQNPWIARENLYAAIVCGERDEVARILAVRPEAARNRGGARGWTPILYLAFTRFTHPRNASALDIARLLLDHGADPNDFYMAGDAQYTVLAGVAAEGEQDAPRQPYAPELFELLLERGAGPFDIQVLYNTHFHGDMLWWLRLVYDHTIDTPRGAAWKDPDLMMFDMGGYGSGARFILETAIKTGHVPLATWALERGANPEALPARDKRFPRSSLYELALRLGKGDIAELLARHGATRSTPQFDRSERFVQACLRLDAAEARSLLRDQPEHLQSPAALFEAARRDRADVLALLVELGFSLELADQTGKRALHEAAAANSVRAARFLLEQGAEPDPRESTYNRVPMGWASYGGHTAVLDLLSGYSRNIWNLCQGGYVERVRSVLAESPALAKTAAADGTTPLWWLPDDEEKALQLIDLFVAAGADTAAANKDGQTAADMARRRAMTDVAARLERGRG